MVSRLWHILWLLSVAFLRGDTDVFTSTSSAKVALYWITNNVFWHHTWTTFVAVHLMRTPWNWFAEDLLARSLRYFDLYQYPAKPSSFLVGIGNGLDLRIPKLLFTCEEELFSIIGFVNWEEQLFHIHFSNFHLLWKLKFAEYSNPAGKGRGQIHIFCFVVQLSLRNDCKETAWPLLVTVLWCVHPCSLCYKTRGYLRSL